MGCLPGGPEDQRISGTTVAMPGDEISLYSTLADKLERSALAASNADFPHESFAYISDNPAKDFVAPNRLGWRTIQLLYPGQVHAHLPAPEGGRPQFTVRMPGEVMQILRA